MKRLLFFLIFTALSILINAQSVPMVFQDWTNNKGTQIFFYKNEVRTDVNSNVYVVGSTINNANNYDILLTKYGQKGELLWSQQYNGIADDDDIGFGLYIDDSSNIYITGSTTDTSSVDLIVQKYNQNGTLLWTSTYNGAGNAYDAGIDVTGDLNGQVYITGTCTNSTPNYDIIALSYNRSNGELQWATQYNYDSDLNDAALKIAVDYNKIFLTGGVQTDITTYKYCTVVLDRIYGTFLYSVINDNSSTSVIDKISDMVQDGNGNIYIAGGVKDGITKYNYDIVKLDSALNVLWEQSYDGPDGLDDVATGIKVDAVGNVYVTGYTTTISDGKNITTIKYDSSGTQQWSVDYNDPNNGDDEATAMTIDASGNIYITGYITTEIDTTDFFTIKYNTLGDEIWNIHTDGFAHLNDKAIDITLDNDGGIIVTGESETSPGIFENKTVRYFEQEIIIPADYNSEEPQNNFEYYANRGQIINTQDSLVPDIRYYTNNSSPAFYIMDHCHSFVFAKADTSSITPDTLHRIDVNYSRCNTNVRTYPLDEQKDYLNYFLGHCPDGVTEVRGNQRLITKDLYPNIDLMFSSNQNGIKYYYIVKPGGDPHDINIEFTGASSFNLNSTTNVLTINSSIGRISFERPSVYQLDTTNQIDTLAWQGAWLTNGGNNLYKFHIDGYDDTKPLVIQVDRGHSTIQVTAIDNLIHSTYSFGNGMDEYRDIVHDNLGNVYITGLTTSLNFPVSNGVVQNTLGGLQSQDAIVQKLNQNMSLQWSTYYGGTDTDASNSISVDINNNVFFAGWTMSTDFPVHFPTGTYKDEDNPNSDDAFIVKLNSNGSVKLWATYYGAPFYGLDQINDVVIDGFGNLYAIGQKTQNTDLYSKTGASNFTSGGGIILKFSNIGERFWATAIGGTGGWAQSVTIDENNNLIVCGTTTAGLQTLNAAQNTLKGTWDAYLIKFDNTDTRTWCTYLGGDDDEVGYGVVASQSGDIFITGKTSSSSSFGPIDLGYPSYFEGSYQGQGTSSFFIGDVFIAKYSNLGSLISSTYYGGSADENSLNIAIDDLDRIYLTGATTSTSFSLLPQNPANTYTQVSLSNSNDSKEDSFILCFSPLLQRLWTSYFGGGSGTQGIDIGYGITTFNHSRLYIVGGTSSSANFPVVDISNGVGGVYYYGALNGLEDGFLSTFDISSIPLSVENNEHLNNNLPIYPNPTNTQAYMSLCIPNKENVLINIYDITGRVLFTNSLLDICGNQKITLDFTSYTAGIYTVKTVIGKIIDTQKIIVY